MTQQPINFLTLAKWTKQHLELMFWFTAMLLLFFLSPGGSQTSRWVFRCSGIEHCPGCGLGHSINHALHARFAQSVDAHLMGIPALIIIFHRITQLIYPKKITFYEK